LLALGLVSGLSLCCTMPRKSTFEHDEAVYHALLNVVAECRLHVSYSPARHVGIRATDRLFVAAVVFGCRRQDHQREQQGISWTSAL
jgi:hypothetical protein